MEDHPSNRTDTAGKIEQVFTYQPPRGDQPERYVRVRKAAKELALEILACCPACADRTAAIRKLREAVMVANASIALEPAGGGEAP